MYRCVLCIYRICLLSMYVCACISVILVSVFLFVYTMVRSMNLYTYVWYEIVTWSVQYVRDHWVGDLINHVRALRFLSGIRVPPPRLVDFRRVSLHAIILYCSPGSAVLLGVFFSTFVAANQYARRSGAREIIPALWRTNIRTPNLFGGNHYRSRLYTATFMFKGGDKKILLVSITVPIFDPAEQKKTAKYCRHQQQQQNPSRRRVEIFCCCCPLSPPAVLLVSVRRSVQHFGLPSLASTKLLLIVHHPPNHACMVFLGPSIRSRQTVFELMNG